MIPVSLILKNFMSYGEERTSVDFTGAHTLCISGDNGNGKSALLDAITYCLWGRTRASGTAVSGEDDLVRLGSEEMEVVFDFRLGADLFRVIRKRNRRTRSGDWQALVSDGEGVWRPIGGTGIRETERCLARLLHMEYETFLNSAYLQQGRADEFTRQKPDARKRILADILDLSRYDRLEEVARSRRQEREMEAKELEGEIRALEARAAEEPVHRESLAAAEARLEEWTIESAKREAALEELRAKCVTLEERARTLEEKEERLKAARREMEEWEEAGKSQTAQLQKIERQLAARQEVERDHARLMETRALLQRMDQDLRLQQQLERDRSSLVRTLDALRHQLESQLKAAETEWRAAEERERQISDLDKRIAQIEPTVARAAEVEKETARAHSELSRAQEEFGRLKAGHSQLEAEIKEIEEVLVLLDAPKSACPVCETDLSGGKRETVIAKQKRRLEDRHAELLKLKRDGAAKKLERDELAKVASGLTAELQTITAASAQRKEWLAQRDHLLAFNSSADAVRTRLQALQRQLAEEAYGREERKSLQEVEKGLAAVAATLAPLDRARSTLRELEGRQVEAALAQIKEAEAARPALLEELEAARKRIEKRREQIVQEQKRLESARAEIADLLAVRVATGEAEARSREAAAAVQLSSADAAREKQAIADCEAARITAKSKEADRTARLKEKQIYTDLAAAFGRAGVQALIIHNVLPEIEDEANRLLSRMTDNAMRVTLTTVREARSRSGQIETLDISITDDAGTRPYEMYSGGEAFRVNFAIRIALSRLLARRAGARLQTLIIDEGFGTQDAKGRERLVEAIQSIHDEFELILVITHVEELKDAFPSRIEVVKTAAGSQILQTD